MKHSKNTSHADNQQERLIKIGWIIGFVDGEGCFSVSFVKQPDKKEKNRIRRGYKTGQQIFLEFVVTQGEKSLESLKMLKNFFGIGKIYVNRRHDNHKENIYRYVVRKREELHTVIVPFFKQHSLQTSKREDLEKFAACLEIIEHKGHLSVKGLKKIARIAGTMNRKKSRNFNKNPQRPNAK